MSTLDGYRKSILMTGVVCWSFLPIPVRAMQLPPEMEVDRYLLQAESAFDEQDFEGAKTAMDLILELRAEHDLDLPEQFSFRYAEVLERLGLYDEAMETVTRYLTQAGRDGEFYRDALELLNAAETAKADHAAAAEAAAEAARRPAGEEQVFDGMVFVWVPAGEFRMGSTSAEAEDDEQPVTPVRISRGLWLGKYEVTQAEWRSVMGTNPSSNSGCDRCPVEDVSWHDVQDFIRVMNVQAEGDRYRLPTEAEWEYAARAGTSGDRYSDNLDEIGWCSGNGENSRPVGRKEPNAWGLHDMLGNVNEWVQDRYGLYTGGTAADPRGPAFGSTRVFRGGNWWSGNCRAAWRDGLSPGERGDLMGLRLLRTE